jgi:hypothetical protein
VLSVGSNQIFISCLHDLSCCKLLISIFTIFIDCILLRGQTGFFYLPSNVTIHFLYRIRCYRFLLMNHRNPACECLLHKKNLTKKQSINVLG